MRVLILALILAFAGGWWLAPREMLDSEVEHTGFLQTDRHRILSATVESLRNQNRLAVYSYKGADSEVIARTVPI